ncbi:unnamed protein product [marine sediment metagenome]|uniref:Uncharacterized protein n=1 Tax=marine sediment metagenome TaxID=412755 RepID=X1HVL0_9ZZZZ
MGGFLWSTIVERDKGKAVDAALYELCEWAQDKPEAVAYFAGELRRMALMLPGEEDSVWRSSIEYFCLTRPGDGEALLFALELPWLWKVPTEVMAKTAELFEKHNVLEVWWDIVGYGAKASGEMDKAFSEAFNQLGVERVEKNKWAR